MNPRAAKRLARYAFTAGALFFFWACPETGLASSTWLTTTDVDFSPGTKVDTTYVSTSGVQTRGAGVPALLELYRDWVSVSTAGGPTSRSTQGVWDTQKNRLFVFGGATQVTPRVLVNETWVLAPGTPAWTQLFPGTLPTVRERVGLAYSTSTKLVYAFYGEDSAAYLRQLWTYDTVADTVWTLQAGGVSSPTARTSAGTAYDEVGNRLIVFGGDNGTSLSDTWAWNTAGSSWTNLAPGTFPAGRFGAAMAYAGSGKIVLFGGDSSGTLKNDTWIFVSTGNTWTSQRAAPAGLTARKRAHLAYDSDLNRVILFGGQGADGGGVAYNDLWYYDVDGDSWAKVDVPNPPTARSEAAVAYSPSQKKLYVYGGMNNQSFPGTVLYGDAASYSLTTSTDASATWTASLPFVSGTVRWGTLTWLPAMSAQPFQEPMPFTKVKFQVYGDNVQTFSAAKLEGPTGAGSFFNETIPGTSSVTIPTKWDGSQYLFVRAYLTGSSTATPHLDSLSVTYNRPPTVPTLSGPADGSIWSTPPLGQPTFTWAGSTDTDNDTLRYRIHINTASDFSGSLDYGPGLNTPISGTSYTPSTLNEGRYYWRVEASDGAFPPVRPDAASGWSPVWTVNVPTVLTVNLPSSDTILPTTATVTWTLDPVRTNPSASHTFGIKMDWGSGDGFNVWIATVLPNGTTSYAWDTRNVPNDTLAGAYRLQVIAVGPYGNASATSASGFRVNNADPLSFSILKPAVSTSALNELWPATTDALSGSYYLRWTNPYQPRVLPWGWTLRVDISSDNGATWKAIYGPFGPNAGGSPLTSFGDPPYASTTIATNLLPNNTSWYTGQYFDGKPTVNNVDTLLRVYMADGGAEVGSAVRQATVTAPTAFRIANSNQIPNPFALLSPALGETIGGTQVTFSWENTGNPGNEDKPTGYDFVNYTLYYSPDPTFSTQTVKSDIEAFKPKTAVTVNNVNMATFPKGGTVTTTVPLNDKTVYYWKVVGVDTQGAFRVSTNTNFFFQVNTGAGVTTNIAPDTEITILSGPQPSPGGYERRSTTFTVDSAGLPSALAVKQPIVKRANDTLRATSFARLASTVAYEIGVFNAAWTLDAGFKPGAFQARIKVKYPSADGKVVDNTTIPVEKLRLARLNESTGEWNLVENVEDKGTLGGTVNAKDKKVESTVTKFSTFALLAYASPSGALDGLKSYPNPYPAGPDPSGKDRATSCTIAYMLAKDSHIDLKIYSGAGDLVWQKTVEPPDPAATAQPVSPRKITWDGRNEDGRLVANGGYLLRLTASPVDGSAEETMTWKLAVLK